MFEMIRCAWIARFMELANASTNLDDRDVDVPC
jgi:hypothetical protein